MKRPKTLGQMMSESTPRQLLGYLQIIGQAVVAGTAAGPQKPKHGERAVRDRARKRRHRANERRRLIVASRSATVRMQAEGFFIEPAAPKRDRLTDLLRRI